jgi:hypothetical protein
LSGVLLSFLDFLFLAFSFSWALFSFVCFLLNWITFRISLSRFPRRFTTPARCRVASIATNKAIAWSSAQIRSTLQVTPCNGQIIIANKQTNKRTNEQTNKQTNKQIQK